MKWIIVGLGYISKRHIDAIEATGGKVVATCDIEERKKLQDYDFYHDFSTLLERNDADAVAICTTNHLHVPMALEAVKFGKKVMCEKPIGLSSEEVKKLPKEVSAMLQLRYHPVLEEIEIKESKRYKVEMNISVKRDQSYWDSWKGDQRRSGGILFNIGIHYFDLLILLFGNEYHVVDSFVSDRTANGYIWFKNADVKFRLAITSDYSSRSLSIDGSHMNLSKEDNLSSEDLHTAAYREFVKGNGIPISEALK